MFTLKVSMDTKQVYVAQDVVAKLLGLANLLDITVEAEVPLGDEMFTMTAAPGMTFETVMSDFDYQVRMSHYPKGS
jgi:hypothetical protein